MRDFFNLFVEQLEDMYSSEMQIIRSLPKLIKAASYSGLKDALAHHLDETKEQVHRLEAIFEILDIEPEQITCEAMKGLLTDFLTNSRTYQLACFGCCHHLSCPESRTL